MERRRVVITGLGAVTPIGLTAGESWQAVKNGVCGIGPITHYDPAAQKVKLAAEVKGFDPEALLGRQESKRMGRFTQFAVAAAREALSDAGFSVEQADPDRCGVILSSGIGGQAITESEHSRGLEKGFDRVSPFYVPTAICNMAAGQVAIDAGLPGHVLLPRHRLRRGHQRRGRRLPLHPGRLRRGHALRRHRGLHHAHVHRRLHLHEGPDPDGGPQSGLHPL